MRTVGAVVGAQVAAALITSRTIGQTSVPAESGFVTAFWLSALAALAALGFALLVTLRRARPHATLAAEAAE